MKIALLTSVAGNGGSAATAFHTAKLLLRRGHEAVLFAPGGYWKERGQKEGVPVRAELELRRGFRPLSLWRDFRAFRKILEDERTDVAIVQKSPEQWLAFLVLCVLPRPVALVRMRGVVFPVRPHAFNRWIHNGMDLVLCSAQAIAAQYKALPGFDTNRTKVLHEGVDTAHFKPATPDEKRAARERFRIPAEARVLGTAGRPSPVKGHDLLLRAFAKALENQAVREREPKVRLCVFADESRRGPGSYESLERLREELGLRDRVDLCPGFVEDMREVYRALDVYVLPSRGSEGSSRAALEACASGLPLLASSVGVLPDLVQDRITGRLVPPDNTEALALALTDLVTDWPASQGLGAAARKRMEEVFREDQYAENLSMLLAETVGRLLTRA